MKGNDDIEAEAIEAAAEAMMNIDWSVSAHPRPPDADLKTYYAMASAALGAAERVLEAHGVIAVRMQGGVHTGTCPACGCQPLFPPTS